MNLKSHPSIAAAVAAAVLFSLAGCAGGNSAASAPAGNLEERDTAHLPSDWDSVVQKANEEGQVVIYTTLPQEQIGTLSTAFNAIYPKIKVNAVTDSSTAITSRFQTEYDATGKAPSDVVHSAAFEALNASKPDWFTDLQKSKDLLPSLADYSARGVTTEHPRSVQVAAYPWQLIINKTQVQDSDAPQSFEAFTDPKYKGKLSILDPRAGSNVAAFYVELRKKFGDGYLTALAKNEPKLSPGVPDLSQSIAAGATQFGFPTNASGARQVENAGAPVARVTSDPVVVGGTTMAIPTNSAHPNAGRVFANFLLTAQAQELQCKSTGLGSLNKIAKGDCAKVEIPADAIFASFLPSEKDRSDVVALLGLAAK
jgi:iron(III) transport system substrate-binding protein